MNTQAIEAPAVGGHRVCPWWVAYFFDNPLRRRMHPADKVLGPYVKEGMTVLDFGCGFGHFSLGMARLVGPSGRVVAADVQRRMLDKTMSRARKAGLHEIIQPLLCNGPDIGSPLIFDFALMSNVLHETPDPASLLHELLAILQPGAKFLLTEPAGHLKPDEFEAEVNLAKQVGFKELERPQLVRQKTVLLQKQ